MLSTILRRSILRRNSEVKTVAALLQQRHNASAPNSKIIRCSMPDVPIPDSFVEEFIFEKLDKWGSKIAVECATTGRSYSYTDLYKKSKILGNSLHRFPSLKQHDTIAIILPNLPEYPILMLGAAQAGLRITTVNPLYTPDEIARQLKDSEAKVIFTLGELWEKVNRAIRSIPNQTFSTVIVNHTQNETPNGTINFNDLTVGDHNLSFNIKRSQDDVLVLPYSSGTTGLPKGVEITNRNVLACLALMNVPEVSYMIDENDVAPVVLPMFHIYGMVVLMLNVLSHGAKLVTISKFDPQLFIDIQDKHQPTLSFAVPPLVLLMINHPGMKAEHLNRLKIVFSGAAPLGAHDIERLREKSKKDLNVLQGYGLTETTSYVCGQTERLSNGIKFGGSGLVARNTELKTVSLDDNKKILGANESGELVVRGPQVMKGYLGNVKETQEVIDSDGWLRTGDIGYYDEDGHIFITDRLKELIKVRGFQVAPAELEEVLRDIPDVEDAAVVGIPHEMFGEVPKAFVVPKKGAHIHSNKIQEYVQSKVAKHKHLLGGVVVVENIPKTASGKILRRSLREL